MKLLYFLAALVCLTICTVARSEPPSGPLLRPPGDFAKWEIVVTFSNKGQKKDKAARKPPRPAASQQPHLQKLVTIKTGRLIHESRTNVLGQTTDIWYDGETQYTRSTNTSDWYRLDGPPAGSAATDPGYHPLPAIGYRDMNLIKEENYVGTISYNKRPCLVFVPGGSLNFDLSKVGDAQKKFSSLETVAYVAEDTRLPVEVRSRGELRIFQFDPPPTRMQTLPSELTTQIGKGNDARTRLNQPAPRPY